LGTRQRNGSKEDGDEGGWRGNFDLRDHFPSAGFTEFCLKMTTSVGEMRSQSDAARQGKQKTFNPAIQTSIAGLCFSGIPSG
jgi:hypothetical protein